MNSLSSLLDGLYCILTYSPLTVILYMFCRTVYMLGLMTFCMNKLYSYLWEIQRLRSGRAPALSSVGHFFTLKYLTLSLICLLSRADLLGPFLWWVRRWVHMTHILIICSFCCFFFWYSHWSLILYKHARIWKPIHTYR